MKPCVGGGERSLMLEEKDHAPNRKRERERESEREKERERERNGGNKDVKL